MRALERDHGVRCSDYAELHRWSIEQPERFWSAIWSFGGVIAETRGRRGRAPRRAHARRPLVSRGAAELRREPAAAPRTQRPALVFRGEDGRRRGADLRASFTPDVSRLRAGTARLGRGARATASPASCPTCPRPSSPCWRRRASARSGPPARPTSACRACSTASARSSPRCCFAADGYFYKAGRHELARARWPRCCAGLPSVERVIVVPYARARPRTLAGLRQGAVRLGEALASRSKRDEIALRALPLRPPALHPVLLGHHRRAQVHRPRRRRHAAAASEGAPAARRPAPGRPVLLLHDLRLDDVELAGLGPGHRGDAACSTTARPSIPTATCCSTSPSSERMTRLRHLAPSSSTPRQGRPRAGAQRTTCRASGRCSRPARRSPPESFDYVYQEIKRDLRLSSISGGTDIVSCFVLGCPILPGPARRDPVPRAWA